MGWKLWVDDQYDDPNTPNRHPSASFLPARNVEEACILINKNGMPDFMQLDHDLGNNDKITTFLRWLAYEYPNGPIPEYNIHSENPVGKKNAESIMKSWAKSIKE